jgi:hypothetical protein
VYSLQVVSGPPEHNLQRPQRAPSRWGHSFDRAIGRLPARSDRASIANARTDNTAMNEKFAPPKVTIRRHLASQICDVVVVVRGQEMVIRCPSYSHALKWSRLECKSYKIPEPMTEFPEVIPGGKAHCK